MTFLRAETSPMVPAVPRYSCLTVVWVVLREAVRHKLQAACSKSNKHSVASLLAFTSRLVWLKDRLSDMKKLKRERRRETFGDLFVGGGVG